MHLRLAFSIASIVFSTISSAATLDQSPASPNDWGYRPDSVKSETNPPGFVWRPNKEAASYEFQCARDEAFATGLIRADQIQFACYCPDQTLAVGKWFWRYRMIDKKGQTSDWSKARWFEVDANAVAFPMPARKELIGRIPAAHPRLFVRPEQMDSLRQRAKTDLKKEYDALIKQCEALLKNPPVTAEPPKYPPEVKAKSEEWKAIWWGNRTYTIKVLDGAATLGFGHLLSDNPAKRQAYGELAKRLLMEASAWDPKGSTNYHYNDEAGMPYVYFFSRAYTFLNDLLSEEDKTKCRAMMRIRGNEMYAHLNPRHLWSPYSSHSNRAWHKLGEAGIAFLGEIPEAEDWVWLSMNVFWNVYPVWSDSDGGWHEGSSYWQSYIERFTFFADIMRVDLGVDAFKKPYFSRVGYYTMYLQPPGTIGGGFGDLVADRDAKANRVLMSALAAQAKNPYWQWYVDSLGGPVNEPGYIGFIRGAIPAVSAKAPDDLPTSRCFTGIGQAYLNTNLKSAKDNVELGFKSSPMGTQSHGYDSNNSFFLYAYGQRLLAPTGRRDIYGSDHHANWMWETKSTNSILINGKGQTPKHSAASIGKITGFYTSANFDYVAGDASTAYGPDVKRYVRHIFFIKPDIFLIYDDVETAKPATVDLLLHSPVEIKEKGQKDIQIDVEGAHARAAILWPEDLKLAVTDKYDVPPRDRIKVKEWHLSAQGKTDGTDNLRQFITIIRVGKDAKTLDQAGDRPQQTFQCNLGYWTLAIPREGQLVEIDARPIGRDDLSSNLLAIFRGAASDEVISIKKGQISREIKPHKDDKK